MKQEEGYIYNEMMLSEMGGTYMKKEEMSGTMANSMDDLKQLGKEMEQMREQQDDEKRERDPKQFDSEE